MTQTKIEEAFAMPETTPRPKNVSTTPERDQDEMSSSKVAASSSSDPSPNTIAMDAVANAIRRQQEEKRERQRQEEEEPNNTSPKRIRINRSEDNGALIQLESIWNKQKVSNDEDRQVAVKKTRDLLSNLLNDLIQDGIQAHYEREQSKQQLKISQEECAVKTREIERLRASERKARESISNLLRTVDASNEEARDQCQAKLVENRLRADLLHMTNARDELKNELVSSQRRCKLLGDDITDTKAKLSRVQQEKMQVERDQQATMSLANALQGNAHSDVDFYKRKVTELNTHIQGLSAILTEKNRQLESLRREKERFMSQNRLASYRADGERKKRASY